MRVKSVKMLVLFGELSSTCSFLCYFCGSSGFACSRNRGLSHYVCATFRFLYDGQRINEDDTPASLEMEDNGPCSFIIPCILNID